MYKRLKFEYARDSLKYLIRNFDIKEIYIPYYLCDVIRHSIVSVKCKPLFYHIDDTFMPECKFPENSYILYPNYFGICGKNVNILVNFYENLIVDNAHAYYAKPQGFACFNSEKKFRNVDKGSYLYIKNTSKDDTDIPKCPKERIRQFLKLHDNLKDRNNLKINLEYIESPFCYPYLACNSNEADTLVSNLVKEGKVIYRYWNPLPKSYNEYKFYERLVPIPLS